MAKTGKIENNNKRIRLAAVHMEKRNVLRKQAKNLNLSDEEREEAQKKLQKLPRNSNPIRIRNRCELTGRPRGVYRRFRLGRIAFRELALTGQLTGVTKSSW